MFLRVLGSLVVEEGSPPTPITLPGAKERALLGRLLISPGQTVSVDLLIEDLWEGAAPPTTRKSLQGHVVRLRTALEPDRPAGSPGRFVVHRGRGYALAVPADAVDASVVLVDAAIGGAALDGGDLERARARFGAALAYWHGEAFEDWRDAGWARGERQRLAEVKAAILEARIDTDLESGRHRDLVPELEGLVAAKPLHEGWWAWLMLALHRSGRRGDALAVARRARRRLAEDLGVDPVLAQMEQSILAWAESFQPTVPRRIRTADPPNGSEAASSASRDCPYRGLAVYEATDANVFCGRGDAIRALIEQVHRPRLTVISGPSGAAKSSLVRAGLLPALSAGARPLGVDVQGVGDKARPSAGE